MPPGTTNEGSPRGGTYPHAGEGDPRALPAAQLRRLFHATQGRESELWSSALLLGSVAAAGFAALVMSNLIRSPQLKGVWAGQPSVLLVGLVALFALFNFYALQQRRLIRRAHAELVSQMALREAAEREALLDPLTGTYNRRYLEHVLEREAHRSDRSKCSLSLVMVDIDDFRSVNSRFGHLEGDRCLRDVARVLLNTFRRSDTVVRYGGDEFLILLPESSEAQAHQAVARLLREAKEWNRARSGAGYEMNLSCGVATYASGTDIAAVLGSADQRMYAHKRRSTGAT